MTDFTTTFEQFFLWERTSRDTLEVKRIYVDMAGDLVAGLVLSQIVYWHLPNREGKARLRVERKGELWLAKARAEWWDECRISPKQADRALNLLQSQGLIEVRLFKFGSAPTKHIRILRECFLAAWRSQLTTNGAKPQPAQYGDPEFPTPGKSISTKGENRILPNGQIHFDQRATSLTETTTEITTAAGRKSEDEAQAMAAAALTEELVSNGVSRSAAKRLARDKPAVCRKCLEYLPYVKYRTTKGAWFANAIEHEFGPPAAYEQAMAQRSAQERASRRNEAEHARKTHQEAQATTKTNQLMQRYKQMEQEQGEAYRAFAAHLEQQRERAVKFAARLSDAGSAKYLAACDSTEWRLKIFEDWLKTNDAFAPGSTSSGFPS